MPKHKTKGPLSLLGAAKQAAVARPATAARLRVELRDSAAAGRGLPALLHPSSLAAWFGSSQQQTQTQTQALLAGSLFFLQLAGGSDCVLHVRVSGAAGPGTIHVDEVQAANLRLCQGEGYDFSIFDPYAQGGEHDSMHGSGSDASDEDGDDDALSEAPSEHGGGSFAGAPSAATPSVELTDLDAEVRLLHTPPGGDSCTLEVDARALTSAFCKQCCGRMLAVSELVVVELPGTPPLLLRVAAANTLTADEQADALGYHCYRGLLTPDTQVYIAPATAAPAQFEQQQQQQQSFLDGSAEVQQQLVQLSLSDQQQHQQQSNGLLPQHNIVQSRLAGAGGGLRLLHAVTRAVVPPATNVVHVFTTDGPDGEGEWFPVRKRLLRPCVALTKAVRDSGDTAPRVSVPIDTLTFDRVLLYLEAQALGRPPPGFAIHLLDDLLQAAEHLGLRSLQQHCQRLLGNRQAALGVYSLRDVQQANASGKVWLLLDGMVLDVGRWLPEHPGGATIIPLQALDCDCSRFFEMYHASRESFMYLQEFYLGELLPCDRPHVPLGGQHAASPEFLAQLAEYTAGFRAALRQRLADADAAGFKSF